MDRRKQIVHDNQGGELIYMIYLSSDWHLIKWNDGVEALNKERFEIILSQLDQATKYDQLIFLGDMFDAEIDPDRYVCDEIRKRISKFYKPIFIRGNNDTQSDEFYKDFLGFFKVEFATTINYNQKIILLSHTSVMAGNKINYVVHGHIHRANSDPDTIKYYHPADNCINLCTKEEREIYLTPIQNIDFEAEVKRNCAYNPDKREKPGMSQFIQNQVYGFLKREFYNEDH